MQPFLSNKLEINIDDKKLQDNFFYSSKYFQLSGYLLRCISFSKKTSALKHKLEKLNDNYIKKILLMRYEVSELAKLFKDNDLEYVILKGMAMQIKNIDPYRQFRDLDILVKKKDLKKAYELLKTFGYAYLNNQSNDDIRYLGDMHHLPPMRNHAGIVIELHHRLTLTDKYQSCPLTEITFSERELCDGVYVPSDKVMLAHTLYHGIIHHELKSGPIFLLDIKGIFKKNLFADDSIDNLLENLGLTEEFKQCKSLLKECENKKYIDNDLQKKFNVLYEGKEIFPDALIERKKTLLRLIKYIKLVATITNFHIGHQN